MYRLQCCFGRCYDCGKFEKHNIATGGIQAATWAQMFAEVVHLLEKTTRLVSPREGTSRVVFPNKRSTFAGLIKVSANYYKNDFSRSASWPIP